MFILGDLSLIAFGRGLSSCGSRLAAEGVEAAEFVEPVIHAEGDCGVAADAGESLQEERSGVDDAGEDFGGDVASDGVFGDAGEVGVDVGVGAQFACGAEEIGEVAGVEGLLVEEAAFTVGMEDTEVVMVLRARHTAGAAVVERELTEIG